MGEIWDEHDEIIQPIRRLSGKEYLVKRQPMRISCSKRLAVDEETEAVSVNGWIRNSLIKIPERETLQLSTAGR